MQSETLALFLAVGAGAAIGGMLRFAVTKIVDTDAFPWATFAVNIIACFIASFITFGLAGDMSQTVKVFVITGIMGGLSTMSTFTTESVGLLSSGSYGYFALNILLNVGVCLVGAIAGRELALAIC